MATSSTSDRRRRASSSESPFTQPQLTHGVAVHRLRRQQEREALGLRRERAQPYVAMFLEPLVAVEPKVQDLVIKNFGVTAAFNVRAESEHVPHPIGMTSAASGAQFGQQLIRGGELGGGAVGFGVMALAVELTSLAHGAGCGCKLPAAALRELVRDLPGTHDERLLVGVGTGDDAAVLRLTDELALVLTIDFFTPIVDDPYDFGRIAAANALSDVYAMGGRPVVAMNVVAFPLERLGSEVLGEILRGGADVAVMAGVSIAGGHSIDDPEPKYGLSVTGVVHPEALITNAGATAGDALVLTKPLGVGAVATARKRGVRDDGLLALAVETMTELNDAASEAARAAGAHAMTDVTGFGLLGHLHSLGEASGVAARIEASAVPVLDGVLKLLEGEDAVSGGSARNRDYAGAFTAFDDAVPEARRRLACDATTSGGLLVAVPPARAGELPGAIVGEIVAGEPGAVFVL